MSRCRCRYYRPRSINASHHAERRITRTGCSPPCASASAATWNGRPAFKAPEDLSMSDSNSDALVFFGATGDLAYKKIFPALQAMLKRGNLNTPVIGVAKAGWNLDNLRARARDSVEK